MVPRRALARQTSPTIPHVDWGTGSYETTARRLEPAAEVVVARLAPAPGERVLDLGCGTGNAALLAAERGADVTAVDPAGRLLDVARGRAEAAGFAMSFLPGDAAAIPLPDAAVDAAVSVFAVIFAPDAQAAARELARVVRPGGRIVLSAWVPTGPFSVVMRARGEALRRATGASGPTPFGWHEPQALRSLFGPVGFGVEVEQHGLAFTGTSAEEVMEQELRDHPMWLETRAVLDEAAFGALIDTAKTVYAGANEDPGAFRVTSPYVVATLTRS
jgi:SAM-dependent methyltransferase